MALSMRERQAITKEMARRYVRASKRERGLMLDELCALTGYDRSYAARRLRERARGEPPRRKRRRGRAPIYGADLLGPLCRVWATLGGICGKRLAAVMARTVAALERHGELELTGEARTQLLAMSAAAIDRLLAARRRRLRLKGTTQTKPGTLLRSQIPVRSFAEWDQGKPGFVEIDLVGHDGGDTRGEFAYSLCVTDVASSWVVRAVKLAVLVPVPRGVVTATGPVVASSGTVAVISVFQRTARFMPRRGTRPPMGRSPPSSAPSPSSQAPERAPSGSGCLPRRRRARPGRAGS